MAAPAVRQMVAADAAVVSAAFRAVGLSKPVARFDRYLAEQDSGARMCFLSEVAHEIAGYVTLLWSSPYADFEARGIPQISDLNVLPAQRRRGVATALLDHVEATASTRSPIVGLGVGLYRDYGDAQRLYVKRGYVPDGRGVMYDYQPVEPGESIRLDDDATLMFVRRLSSSSTA